MIPSLNRPLYIMINYNRDTDFVNEKINFKRSSIVILKSSEDKYNVKTHRIAEGMEKYGWEIRNTSHTQKKNPLKRRVAKIMLLIS